MINNYVAIFKQIADEIFSYIDEFEDEDLIFGGNTVGFKFKTDDNLVYNEKNNIPVCVISLSSVIKKTGFIVQCLNYKNVCMKIFLKKYKTFLCINIKDG